MTPAGDAEGSGPERFELTLRHVRQMNLVIPVMAGLTYVAYLGAGGNPRPGVAELASLAAAHFCQSFAISYNDYRGRLHDALSPKRPFRPLAGHAERVPWVEGALALVGVGAVGLPWLVGAYDQAVVNGVTVVGYAVLFGNREGGHASAALKTTTALMVPFGSIWGLVVGCNLDTSFAWFLAAVVAVFRLGVELTQDAADVEADLAYGIRTVATRFGARRTVLVSGVVSGLAMTLLTLAATRLDLPGSEVVAIALMAVAAAAMAAATIVVARSNLRETWALVRQASDLFLFLTLAAFLGVQQGWLFGGVLLALLLRLEWKRFGSANRRVLNALGSGRDAAS